MAELHMIGRQHFATACPHCDMLLTGQDRDAVLACLDDHVRRTRSCREKDDALPTLRELCGSLKMEPVERDEDDDPITAAIYRELRERAARGVTKYGVTAAERTDLTRKEWLQHLLEEMLDAAVYTKKLIEMEGP